MRRMNLKGEDLVKICSLYENYKFRTPQRLLNALPARPGETATHAPRRTTSRREQICTHCSLVEEAILERPSSRRHPSGKLRIKCGEEVDEASVICRLHRCQIGDEENSYKHADPPLMVSSNKLPPIPKQIRSRPKSKGTQGTAKETRNLETTGAEKQGREDGNATGSTGNGKGRKVVSFGGARIVDDRWLTKGWGAHRTNYSLQLKHPASRFQVPGADLNQDSNFLPPRRGRLHTRFPVKKARRVHPATAYSKAEDSRGIKPTLPLAGVSILKPAKPLMVIPTPCFPCSPEFEHTFKSLRGQKK